MMFVKSYTDTRKNLKWCPHKGCEHCAEDKEFNESDVLCKCGNSFCFKCGLDSHRPCTCKMAKNWNNKN